MELTLAGKEPELQKFTDASRGIQASHVFSSSVHCFAYGASGAISMGIISYRAVYLFVQGAERLTTDLVSALVGKERCQRFYSFTVSFKKEYLERSSWRVGHCCMPQGLHHSQTAGTHVL